MHLPLLSAGRKRGWGGAGQTSPAQRRNLLLRVLCAPRIPGANEISSRGLSPPLTYPLSRGKSRAHPGGVRRAQSRRTKSFPIRLPACRSGFIPVFLGDGAAGT